MDKQSSPNEKKAALNLRLGLQKDILRCCLILSLTLALSANADEVSQSDQPFARKNRPNILILFVDDMGYGDAGCYNGGSLVPTPHIDRLAKEGLRFTDAHAASSVCTPSRYALLTGRYCWRSRLTSSVLAPLGKPLIETTRPTLPKTLQQNSYRTAIIGKWHLGLNWGLRDQNSNKENCQGDFDFSKPITEGPLAIGFEYFYGLDLPSSPLLYLENRGVKSALPPIPMNSGMYGGGNTGIMEKGFKQEEMQPQLTRKCVEYIHNHKTQHADTPFFLFASFVSPHSPIVPTKKFRNSTKATLYGDYVHQTDFHIGEILDALDQNELTEDTLVLFASDNGSPERCGTGSFQSGPIGNVTRLSKHRPNSPLRGRKGDIWEAGHRIPFIARWPNKIKANQVCNQLVGLNDIHATLASLLNLPLSKDEAPDSVSFLPLLLKPSSPSLRTSLVHHSMVGVFAIRHGDWKLIPDELGSGSPYSLPTHKQPSKEGPQGQLYNLKDDLDETTNLYAQHPEKVKELRAMLKQIQSGN